MDNQTLSSVASSGPGGSLGSGSSGPSLVASSGSGGSLGSGLTFGCTSATAGRKRTPGRWRRIPRATAQPAQVPAQATAQPAQVPARATAQPAQVLASPPWLSSPAFEHLSFRSPEFELRKSQFEPTPEETEERWRRSTFQIEAPKLLVFGSREYEEMMVQVNRDLLEKAKQLEEADEDLCENEEVKARFRAFKVKFSAIYRDHAAMTPENVVFKFRPPSDTEEEHLTAEEMEVEATRSGWLVCPQAQHFAALALAHYNSNRKTHTFEMGTVLLSKCFTERDDTTFAHVNFTATSQQSDSPSSKRLFFAELMLIPDIEACKGAEPMRVLHVCMIDDLCFGGCHEMERDIKEPLRKDLDFERCHACSSRIKHPRGRQQTMLKHGRTHSTIQTADNKRRGRRVTSANREDGKETSTALRRQPRRAPRSKDDESTEGKNT
ncbi:hypothetical protein ACP70R_005135 [Stipagrostis hirtigluma subsp. patula]